MKKRTDQFVTVGNIWTVSPVSDQPVIRLARWAVFEVETHERYLVGFNLADEEGRVSTAIQTFDSVTCRAVTMSGRTYQMIGSPGYDPDGNWLWSCIMRAQNMKYRDVTHEYVNTHVDIS